MILPFEMRKRSICNEVGQEQHYKVVLGTDIKLYGGLLS
jgi:hypothetical protein